MTPETHIHARLEALERQCNTLSLKAEQVAVNSSRLDILQREMLEVEASLRSTRDEILSEVRAVKKDILAEKEARGRRSTQLVVAVVAGCFAILASLVTAISIILTSPGV